MLIKQIAAGAALVLGGLAFFIEISGRIFKRRVDDECTSPVLQG
jgi:hypothetical protein